MAAPVIITKRRTAGEGTGLLLEPPNNATRTPSMVNAVSFAANIYLVVLLLTWLAVTYWYSNDNSIEKPVLVWVVNVVIGLLLGLVWLYSLLSLHGLYLWHRGELPLSTIGREEKQGAKYVTAATTDHRTIEYFVWGSEQIDAKVVVLCHGSNTTGKHFNQFLYPTAILKLLNVKAISPSYPGHGGSDAQPFRNLQDWPKTDLEPILVQERVDQFLVQGTSYGTAHAMAVASYFDANRCTALGLNVPYLPENICREFGFRTDADYVLSQNSLQKSFVLLPLLSMLSLGYKHLAKAAGAYPEGRLAKFQNPSLLAALDKDCRRSFLRGPIGQVYEMFNSTTTQRWPDPRLIRTRNVAVWYADDDSLCPPAHGKWLADIFSAKEQAGECQTRIRCEKRGLGHFTYMGEDDPDRKSVV